MRPLRRKNTFSMETFNHHQAKALANANLQRIEEVALRQYEELNAYKLSKNPSPKYIERKEAEIAQLYQSVNQARELVEMIADNYSHAVSRAFTQGQEQERRKTDRLQRYGGIDPLSPLTRHQKEALRHYNIAQQRLRDNI